MSLQKQNSTFCLCMAMPTKIGIYTNVNFIVDAPVQTEIWHPGSDMQWWWYPLGIICEHQISGQDTRVSQRVSIRLIAIVRSQSPTCLVIWPLSVMYFTFHIIHLRVYIFTCLCFYVLMFLRAYVLLKFFY